MHFQITLYMLGVYSLHIHHAVLVITIRSSIQNNQNSRKMMHHETTLQAISSCEYLL